MKAQKFLKNLVLLVVVVNLAIFLMVLLRPSPPVVHPLPIPNGYDDSFAPPHWW